MITIIVLMILAGVSLSFVLGDNGILKKAQESADAYKNKAGEESNTLDMVNGYLEGLEGKTTDASNSTSYVGYYADSDGDGTVDGIIYADLAVGGSGTWQDTDGGNDHWSDYKYSKVTEGLKKYSISTNSYAGFGGKWTKPVLTAIEGSETQDRFYIMALEDVNSGTGYCWYNAAYGKLDYNPIASDANDFGQGKTNTIAMVEEWNKGANGKYGAQNKKDLWGVIQGKTVNDSGEVITDTTKVDYYNKGWFVPSKAEWSAFGDMVFTKMKATTSTCIDYGLKKDVYWSSAMCNGSSQRHNVYTAEFKTRHIGVEAVVDAFSHFVRLSATF